jgi:hypothetical protein
MITAATILLFGLASGVSHARGDEGRRDNGQHKAWYKKDKDRGPQKAPVSVPEPGTMVLLITGLAAAMVIGRRRPKV